MNTVTTARDSASQKMPAPHPLAVRIHDRVLGLIGTALMKTELCERLAEMGRHDEVAPTLGELREALNATVVELRSIMAELRDESLKNRAA